MPPRSLRIAAVVEAVTLLLMLVNIATVHAPTISATLGPLHGCAYLWVVIGTLRRRSATRSAKLVAFVPGIGGLLAVRFRDAAAEV